MKLWNETLVRFWYSDRTMPQLYGPLRFIFYSCLLLYIYRGKDKSLGHATMQDCEEKLVNIFGHRDLGLEWEVEALFVGPIIEFVYRSVPLIGSVFLRCGNLVWGVKIGTTLSAVGVGGKIPRFVAAIGYWMQVAIHMADLKPSGHAHNIPVVAAWALCFAEGNLIDCWSVDSFLVKLWRWANPGRPIRNKPPERSYDSPAPGRAASKFIMVYCVIAMFFAGLHKVADSGFTWLDGATILSSVKGSGGSWKSLRIWIINHHQYIIPAMAVSTILGEIGSVAILLWPWWRPFGVAMLWLFHLGVRWTVGPNFYGNMISYLLFVDWRGIFGRKKTAEKPMPNDQKAFPASWSAGSWIYTLLVLAAFLGGLLKIDAYPLFSWSLYTWHPSQYESTIWDASTLRKEARHCLTYPPIYPSCKNFGATCHHGKFRFKFRKLVSTLSIIEDKGDAACPVGVYKNWSPHSCIGSNSTKSIEEQLLHIAIPVSEEMGNSTMRTLKGKPPKLPMKQVFKNLMNTVVDVAAVTIDNGSICLDPTKLHKSKVKGGKHTRWSRDDNRHNAVSRLARQLRLRLSDPAFSEKFLGSNDRQVLAIGASLEYVRTNNRMNYCILGQSVLGENSTGSLESQELWNSLDLPLGDFSVAAREIWFIFTLFIPLALASKWHQKPRHKMFSPRWRKKSHLFLGIGAMSLFVVWTLANASFQIAKSMESHFIGFE